MKTFQKIKSFDDLLKPELLLDSSPSKEKSMKSAQKFANKATNKFIALTIKELI